MAFFDSFNLIMWFIVVSFWATVILFTRARGRPLSPRLLIVPTFFLLIGTMINRARFPFGTYAIAVIHVMMLPALLRIAKSKP